MLFLNGCGLNTSEKASSQINQPQTTQTQEVKPVQSDGAKLIQVINDKNAKIYELSKADKFDEARVEFKAMDEAFNQLKPAITNEDLKKKLDHAIDEVGDEMKKQKPKKGEIEEEYEVINKVIHELNTQIK
jgi:hypothetical protein